MNQQYFNINIPKDPVELIKKLDITLYTLLDNGRNNFMLGYFNHPKKLFKINTEADFDELDNNQSFLFGYIPYDQKNQFLPKSISSNKSFHGFESTSFFEADGVLILKDNISLFFGTKVEYEIIKSKLENFAETQKATDESCTSSPSISLAHETNKKTYISNVKKIKQHIQNGDIYEVNYCINFKTEKAQINSLKVYEKLRNNTRAPFSAKVHFDNLIVLSASPERFLNKSYNILSSQPIKGTIKRGQTESEDIELKKTLLEDQKEIAENVMIVDLVRNDLSKIALKSTVNLKELCQLYTFKTVHQLISTIQCEIHSQTKTFDILKSLFPMGSMTGAPKISATNVIERFENFKREIYSGAIGYIAPNKSFDFNVVIRSIVHNQSKNTLSISVGSAITAKSAPESEYNECLLKLDAIQSVLR